MEVEVENNQLEEEADAEAFMKTFSKKVKYYDSLFLSSFSQKINHKQLINYSNINEAKFCEFDVTSPDMVSDLSTLTAHMTCRVRELKDGQVIDLATGVKVSTIPGSVISNAVRNLRVYLFESQISPERENRYSLLSYIFEYFNKSIVRPKGINYANGSYFDQAKETDLVTSEAKVVPTKTLLNAGAISQGYYDSANFFKESTAHNFVDRIYSPFLFTKMNLLLPKVRRERSCSNRRKEDVTSPSFRFGFFFQVFLKIALELRGSDESGFILRYDDSANTTLAGRKFLFVIDRFYLSILRLRPMERIRTRLHKLLSKKISHPILNCKLHERILIRRVGRSVVRSLSLKKQSLRAK